MNLLGMLDAVIQQTEQRLSRLREVRSVVAELEDAPPIAAPGPSALALAEAPSRRRRVARADAKAETTLRNRVLAFLNKQDAPVTRKDVVGAVRAPVWQVAPEIKALVAEGKVVKRGERRGLRLGTPKVMAEVRSESEGD